MISPIVWHRIQGGWRTPPLHSNRYLVIHQKRFYRYLSTILSGLAVLCFIVHYFHRGPSNIVGNEACASSALMYEQVTVKSFSFEKLLGFDPFLWTSLRSFHRIATAARILINQIESNINRIITDRTLLYILGYSPGAYSVGTYYCTYSAILEQLFEFKFKFFWKIFKNSPTMLSAELASSDLIHLTVPTTGYKQMRSVCMICYHW